jgi:hypothetical protein
MDYVNAVETLIEYKIKRRNGRKGKSVQWKYQIDSIMETWNQYLSD